MTGRQDRDRAWRRRRAGYDPRLRFRVYVGGQLADETWVNCSQPSGKTRERVSYTSERQQQLVKLADAAGIPWALEVYDPDLPEDQAYVRVGTDTSMMADPRPVDVVQLPPWTGAN